MMNHIEVLTRYVTNFVDELVQSGLQEVVISPGSRSTPLAMTMMEHENIKEWVVIDERSAAFFALGMAKQTDRPVAIVCTSGTAVANYFPAIVEAHYSRVPLIILTADRPHELRDIGAPQAIEQINMYGDFIKWFHEMALPEATIDMLMYVRGKASRAVYVSKEGNAGPVHLNFPFREPLVPDFTLDRLWTQEELSDLEEKAYNPLISGTKRLSAIQLHYLVEKMITNQKGVIVCGPQINSRLAEHVAKLASLFNIPILADPLSQCRAGQHEKGNIVESYDAIFRNQQVRKQLKPDYIIRFGAMPVSKTYLFYIEEHKETAQFVVEDVEGTRDPTGHATEFIYADPCLLCEDIVKFTGNLQRNKRWLNTWKKMNDIAKKHILHNDPETITEGTAVKSLLQIIPKDSILYVGNSMAVRDLDTFFMNTENNISVLSNRGASGIDGMVSSALGAAAGTASKPVTLLIGDLSFYHDLNALLIAKHYELNMTILLINNNGGGIFSFLPQAADKKYFEVLFGTPLDIEFEQAISMYNGKYIAVKNAIDLKRELASSYENKGLSVIEVKTNREENVEWHRHKWSVIEEELLMNEWWN